MGNANKKNFISFKEFLHLDRTRRFSFSLISVAENSVYSCCCLTQFTCTVQWAEVIGARLDEMIAAEKLTYDQVNSTLSDGEKQKELLSQDEEEDFLDEGKICIVC